jgi:hypothetical protein
MRHSNTACQARQGNPTKKDIWCNPVFGIVTLHKTRANEFERDYYG